MSYKKVNHGFLVDGRVLIKGQEEINISPYIQNIMVRKRFISEYFPLFTINLMLTETLRDNLRDNDFSLYLRVSYYNVDDSTSTESEDGTHNTEIGKIFEGNIRIYDKPFTTTASRNDVDNENDDNQMKDAMAFIPYTISGIPEELIAKNETIVNNVYKNCNLADALVNQLTAIDKNSKMHIQKLTNTRVYPFILFPALNLIPALEFVDEKYLHFYKHGFSLFFDGNDTYFYDPYDNNSDLVENIFECNIIDKNATADSDTSQNVMIDENNNLKMNYKTAPHFSIPDKTATHALGSHTISYAYDDNFYVVTKTKDNDEAYNKVRYIWSKLRDESKEVLDIHKYITLSLNNVNPELFKPITLLKVLSSDYKEVAGNYCISEVAYTLNTSDHKSYSSSISVLGIGKQ